MAVVMAGGRGQRLQQLTDHRAKPATPFGGKYRIIDFSLSNCVNSGIRQILILTQYKAQSLIQHVQRGWGYLHGELGEFIDIVPAQQKLGEMWYRGTADAVFQNLDIIDQQRPETVLVLAGDHVYKMDYEPMLRQHVEAGADVTVGCFEVPRMEAVGFGVIAIDENDHIVSFLEKPRDPPGMPGKPDKALASMGIYVFETQFLIEELRRDASEPNSSRDFGKDIIPHLVNNGKAVAHHFSRSCVRSTDEAEVYWRDVGTIDAYWEANIDLTAPVPALDLYDRAWPIWTYAEITPPAKFVHDDEGRRGKAVDSLVSGGCIISGASLRRSLLFTGVHVHSFAEIENAVVMPYVDIGRSTRLSNVVVDRGVKIPEGLVVGEDPVRDAQRFRRTERGICLITQNMIDRMVL